MEQNCPAESRRIARASPVIAKEILTMPRRKTSPAADTTPSPAMDAAPKRKAGRPPIERDEAVARRVSAWVAAGISVHNIASLEKMSPPTLRRLYMRELEVGAAQANGTVAMSLYRATATDWRAAALWLKCRAGWYEATGPEGPDALGKKEVAELMSKVAQQGTGWANLLK